MSEEEPVDKKVEIEEACKPECKKYMKEYEGCVERVRAKGSGQCTGQYFDLYHCIDKCAAPKIFKNIK